uniref:ribonuclease H n=1 Tax=Setaria digitata TaxID=48799 RepID=A0A915Q097_9BILA
MYRFISNFVRRGAGWNNLSALFTLRNENIILEDSTQTINSTIDKSDSISSGEISSSNESTGTRTPTGLPPVVVIVSSFFRANIRINYLIPIYTDGSCVENYASGIGIYFGPNHPLNKSKAIHGYEHNSGLAEIIAVKMALKSLRKWNYYKGENVILRTDFLPLIYAMNNDGFNGRFHKEYLKLKQLASKFPNGVQFEHVFGHEGEHGNEEANNLARQATIDARLARSRSASPFRGVPYDYEFPKRPHSRSRSRSHSRNVKYSRRVNSIKHRRSRSAYIPGKYSRTYSRHRRR